MKTLDRLATSDAPVVVELTATRDVPTGVVVDAMWDNQPTWDNWAKNPAPFDNRPTWDNWSKKNGAVPLLARPGVPVPVPMAGSAWKGC